MLRLLHTADWHIGKQLYKHPLYDDITLFLDELKTILIEESIDILLIAGDIFDLANPSNKDKEIYYGFLAEIQSLNIQTIITSGNHDSSRMLDAPASLLQSLNVHVVGETNHTRQVIPIYDSGAQGPNKNPIALILAIPFLREKDVRSAVAGESSQDKKSGLREGIAEYYRGFWAQAQKNHPNTPLIAMGHLYMQGVSLSESERDIHIGNQAGLPVTDYTGMFDYFALGHIHKPQRVGGDFIQYSGSPISLSFSERKDEKRVIILELEEGKLRPPRSRKLRKYRELIRFTGSLHHVQSLMNNYSSKADLPTLFEIIVKEEKRDLSIPLQLTEWAQKDHPQGKIIRYKLQFNDTEKPAWEKELDNQLEDLNPIDVFEKRLDISDIAEDQKLVLTAKFKTLYQEWNEKQNTHENS